MNCDHFVIALAQVLPDKDEGQNKQASLQKGLDVCQKAKNLGADLVVFPEMWQIGYRQDKFLMENAVDLEQDFIQQFRKAASTLKIAIAITYLGKGKKKPTNHLALIDAKGNVLLDYAKVHLCDFEGGTDCGLEAGNTFEVADCDYGRGYVKLGGMICFDREFSESAKTLMLKGAEIIIVPNACPLHDCPVYGDARIAMVRAMAVENMVGVAVANYPAPDQDGHSCAFDVFGKAIAMAGTKEEIVLAKFDLAAIRQWRFKEKAVRGPNARRVGAYEL